MKSPIGFFDSGCGGLSILRPTQKRLKKYDYLYLGDNANAPYGGLSFEEIYQHTESGVEYLARNGCKLIIIACNTASAKALRNIQQKWLPNQYRAVRVLGIIIPVVEQIPLIKGKGHNNHVGILATTATVFSETFRLEINKLYPNVTLHQQACPGWVEMIESYHSESEITYNQAIDNYLVELKSKCSKIETLILGCTHYALLESIIKINFHDSIHILNSGNIVAKSIEKYLHRHPEVEALCSKGGKIDFRTTSPPTLFERVAKLFLQQTINATKVYI